MQKSRIIKAGGSTWRPFDWEPEGERSRSVVRASGVHEKTTHDPASTKAIEEYTRQAYERGYREGEAAARAAHEEATQAVSRELARTVASLSQHRSSIFQKAQADLLRLSVAIARRVLHRELLVSPDILEGIISVVLGKLDRQEVYRVRVHPAMVKRVEEELKRLAHHRAIQVAADSSLDPGGCVFETGRGNIDAGIESQLTEIERGLADHLEA